jgi:hypothetical protein
MAKTAARRASVHSNAVALVDHGGGVVAMGALAQAEAEAEGEGLVEVLEVEDIVDGVCRTSCMVIEMVLDCDMEYWANGGWCP